MSTATTIQIDNNSLLSDISALGGLVISSLQSLSIADADSLDGSTLNQFNQLDADDLAYFVATGLSGSVDLQVMSGWNTDQMIGLAIQSDGVSNIASLTSNSFASLAMVSISVAEGMDSLDELASVFTTDSTPQSVQFE